MDDGEIGDQFGQGLGDEAAMAFAMVGFGAEQYEIHAAIRQVDRQHIEFAPSSRCAISLWRFGQASGVRDGLPSAG